MNGSNLFIKKNRYGIQSEYVYPFYFYVGFWSRFIAFSIDSLVVLSLRTILLNFPFYLFDISLGTMVSVVYFISNIFVLLLYFTLMTKWMNGQTIGKIIMGIRVVHIGEEELSWTTVVIREAFGRIILITIPLLYLTIFFTKYKQHFVDLLCDTSVISEKIFRASSDAFVYIENNGLNHLSTSTEAADDIL